MDGIILFFDALMNDRPGSLGQGEKKSKIEKGGMTQAEKEV